MKSSNLKPPRDIYKSHFHYAQVNEFGVLMRVESKSVKALERLHKWLGEAVAYRKHEIQKKRDKKCV